MHPDPEIKPTSPALAGRLFTSEPPAKPSFSGAAAAKSLQSSPTLCNPIDSSLPGSSVPGILQARTLEWVAISFSNAWKWKVKVKSLSHVQLFCNPMDCSQPGPSVHGIFQARVLEWGAIAFSHSQVCNPNLGIVLLLTFLSQVSTCDFLCYLAWFPPALFCRTKLHPCSSICLTFSFCYKYPCHFPIIFNKSDL